MNDIIRRPLITEKAMRLNSQGQYVFEVDPKTNKIEIKKAIEEMFEVHVKSVRTARIKGKIKKRFTRKGLMTGKTSMIKKAYITLREGETIDVVAGEAAE